MTDKPRCRPLPPSVVDARVADDSAAAEAELLARLDDALAALPEAERTAVIASFAYGEGPVGAAMELDVETGDAERLGLRGLALLRVALDEC